MNSHSKTCWNSYQEQFWCFHVLHSSYFVIKSQLIKQKSSVLAIKLSYKFDTVNRLKTADVESGFFLHSSYYFSFCSNCELCISGDDLEQVNEIGVYSCTCKKWSAACENWKLFPLKCCEHSGIKRLLFIFLLVSYSTEI